MFFAHSTVIYNYEKAYLPAWLAKSWPWWALKVFLTKQVRRARRGTAQHSSAHCSGRLLACWGGREGGSCSAGL